LKKLSLRIDVPVGLPQILAPRPTPFAAKNILSVASPQSKSGVVPFFDLKQIILVTLRLIAFDFIILIHVLKISSLHLFLITFGKAKFEHCHGL
jgi:hypothetical protein